MFDVIRKNNGAECRVYAVEHDKLYGETWFLFWNMDEWIWDNANNYKAKPLSEEG